MDEERQNEQIEIELLLEAVYRKYSYDFRNYAKASLRRRVRRRLLKSGSDSISQMIHRVLYERAFFEELLLELTINVTEMFRNPNFFSCLRQTVMTELKNRPLVKIWHAGCATGEEVYSMAIMLREEMQPQKVRIYATDANEAVLAQAKKGIFPLKRMQDYTRNYIGAGGKAAFSDYYTARFDHAIMDVRLKDNIVFADHNLASDGVFGEMDLILCRNVMIYFNRDLQERVFNLFHESLRPGGFLCLGAKETIRLSKYSRFFETLSRADKIYRKSGYQRIPRDLKQSPGEGLL